MLLTVQMFFFQCWRYLGSVACFRTREAPGAPLTADAPFRTLDAGVLVIERFVGVPRARLARVILVVTSLGTHGHHQLFHLTNKVHVQCAIVIEHVLAGVEGAIWVLTRHVVHDGGIHHLKGNYRI